MANLFIEKLDTVFCIEKEAIQDKGEDSYFVACNENSAIVSVFDGAGGLGFKRYDSLSGKTGAYMASRLLSGAICDWYHNHKVWSNFEELILGIKDRINASYHVNSEYTIDTSKIQGSLVRDFPSTMAMAFAQIEKKMITLHVVWAGDSRIYLLNEGGLAQLTVDDTYSSDAFENLYEDEAMTNIVSSDGQYKLNYRKIQIEQPTIILACTDGCFGYLSSPMDFELLLLEEIMESVTLEELKTKWYKEFSSYAGDDFTLGFMSFLFGDFENTKKKLKKVYTRALENATYDRSDMDDLHNTWRKYKANYERYFY